MLIPFTSSCGLWIVFNSYITASESATKQSNLEAHLLMKSRACAFSCVALCMSANMSTSQTLSTVKFEHNASSHITFSLSRSYCKQKNILSNSQYWKKFQQVVLNLFDFTNDFLFTDKGNIIGNQTRLNSFEPEIHFQCSP